MITKELYMKNILFFDTETTGLPKDYSAPAYNIDNWPRLVQFGYILSDYNRNIKEKGSFIINPNGFDIPDGATKIHGITTDIANKKGISIESGFIKIKELLINVDLLIGHNIDFDINIINSESYRLNNSAILKDIKTICTKDASANFCALPNNKWPKLEELHAKLFGCKFEGAHNALADITATAKCFWGLVDKGVICINNGFKTNDKTSIDINIISELSALNKFYYKLRLTNINDTIEDQMAFLFNFLLINDNNLLKTNLVDYQDHFIRSLYDSFISTHKELFQDKQTDEDKFYSTVAMGHLGHLYTLDKSKEYRNKVISRYYDILHKYESYFHSYIISNGRFDLTVNSAEVFKMYSDLLHEHIIFCKSMNIGNHLEKTHELVDKYIPIINTLRQKGLDNKSYSRLFSDIFLGKFNAALFVISDLTFSGALTIKGLNDKLTITSYINLLNKLNLQVETPPDCRKSINDIAVKFKNIINSYKGNGCLVILPFMLTGLTYLISLIIIFLTYIF